MTIDPATASVHQSPLTSTTTVPVRVPLNWMWVEPSETMSLGYLERIANALEFLVAQAQADRPAPVGVATPEISRGDYFRKDLGERREGAWHQAYSHRRWAGTGEVVWSCKCRQRAAPMPGRSDRPIEVSRTRPTSGLFCKALRGDTG